MSPMGTRERIAWSYMAHVRGERRSLLWAWLAPAALLHRAGVAMWSFLYRHGLRRVEEPPLPVISVGNLTYGGTNKTPFVEMLARALMERGVRVGIVSRGYSGGRSEGATIVRDGGGARDDVGDEPLLLSRRLPGVPVAVARRRIEGVRALKDEGVELAIADDAFQHRALGRDVDIVLIDSACPFGSRRLIPSGILREPAAALSRAHMVVLTKADQATPEALEALRSEVARLVPEEKIVTSRLAIEGWATWDGELCPCPAPSEGTRVFAFSAIGSPGSFARSLKDAGLRIVGERRFRDHHRYGPGDIGALARRARACEAEALVCTEKDLYNLPACVTGRGDLGPSLLVPRVAAALDDPERCFDALTDALRPRLIVASNGYGEDAIGSLLARRLRDRLPCAEVMAFPLVGRGDAYADVSIPVRSAPSITPSGGIVKYRLRDLLGDMRAGLLRHIQAQLRDWEALRGRVRTPLCVGDVYLLLHTLWGSGARPLFVATAKTVHLTGHWRTERALIRRLALRTWARDEESAAQLQRAGADAVWAGSPIMDLLGDAPLDPPPRAPGPEDVPLILLLPGSRDRAYEDVELLLDASLLLGTARPCAFRMVLAPTISLDRLIASCRGWDRIEGGIERDGTRIELTDAPVAEAARGGTLLLGLGGTANQLCAGLGIPVVSIDEKGKRVQKKLLGDAEVLVPPTARALADEALQILSDAERYGWMSEAGRRRMGAPGALADMVGHAVRELGWDVRAEVYERLRALRGTRP